MRKFIFGISLLLLISLLGLISIQTAPIYKVSAVGALDHFVFRTISAQKAGTAFQITITAVDIQGSTVTSYVGTNTLSPSTGVISPTSTGSFTKGSWTGQVTLTRAATGVTISTAGSTKSGTSNTFNVNAGNLALFIFQTISTQTAGTPFSIKITAQDAYGNTVTTYTGTNTLSDSTGTINPKTTGAFSAGSWTGQITIRKATTSVTISTSGSSKVGQSNSITVSPGALFLFTITGYPASVVSGQDFGSNNVVVTAYDAYGNIKTDYAGSVYFTSTDAQSVLPFTSESKYMFTSGASRDNGIHTFPGIGFMLKTTPSQTITVTDGSKSATSNSIKVTAKSITVTSNPTGSGYIKVDGKTYATPAAFNWTIGESHNISANSLVILISNQSRYVYSNWSDGGLQSHTIVVSSSSPSIFIAGFQSQYYLSVSGGDGAGWYNSSVSASSTASYVLSQVSGQSRRNLYEKIVDGVHISLPRAKSGSSTQSFKMSTYHTIIWSYHTQYYLNNNFLDGSQYNITASPTEDSWYDNGTSVSVALQNIWSIVTNQSRSNLERYFNGTISRDIPRTGVGTVAFSIAMTTYRTINDTSVKQYYLKIIGGNSTSYGTASPTSDNWYDSGTSTTVSSSWVLWTVTGRSRIVIANYTIDGSGQSLSRRGEGILTTPSVSMTKYHTIAFLSVTQYYFNVTGGNSVLYGTASPTSDNWYDSGTFTTVSSKWVWNTVSNQSRMVISNLQLDGINQNPVRRNSGTLTSTIVSMTTYHTLNFVSTIQYDLTVLGGNGVTYGTASQTSDNWYDSGTSTTVSSNWMWNVVSGKNGTGISNWELDGVNQTVLLSEGFEDDYKFGNYTQASGTGSITIVGLDPHSGTSALKFVSDAGGYSHSIISFKSSTIVYARAYYKFSTLNLGSWKSLGLFRLDNGDYINSVTVQILYHDGNYYWELATSDGVNNYYDQSESSNITTGKWYCIEVKRDVINGQEQLWVDGVSKVSATHHITGNTDRLEVGITYGGNVTGKGNTCYVDDIVITGTYDILSGPKILSSQGLEILTTPSIMMSTYHTLKFRSTLQFFLTVNSTYSVVGGVGWYDSGSIAYATLVNGTVYNGTGIQYVFTKWIGDASGLGLISSPIMMDAAKTATANWKGQYSMVLTDLGSVSTLTVVSNSTVTGLSFNITSRKLSFIVNGAAGTMGYADITVAKSLIGDINGVDVYLDGNLTSFNSISTGDDWLLQVMYEHSIHRVDVSLGSALSTANSVGFDFSNPMVRVIGIIPGLILFATVVWPWLQGTRRRSIKTNDGR